MKIKRFELRTDSHWKNFYIAVAAFGVMILVVSLIFAPTVENFSAGAAAVLLIAVIAAPVLFIGTRRGGNFVELLTDELRLRKVWVRRLGMPYSDIVGLTDGARHNPLAWYVLHRGLPPLETHVDLQLNTGRMRRRAALGRWATVDGIIHISPGDRSAFVAELTHRLEAARASAIDR